jgi:hypothetical protein
LIFSTTPEERIFDNLHLKGVLNMAKGQRLKPEQIVTLLRQIDVLTTNGKTLAQACKEVGTVEQSYYRRRNHHELYAKRESYSIYDDWQKAGHPRASDYQFYKKVFCRQGFFGIEEAIHG